MKQKNYFSIVRATLLVLLGMLLVPSPVKADQTTVIDFQAVALGAYYRDNMDADKYYANITMKDEWYSPISGARKGDNIKAYNSNTVTADISRLAFRVNSIGKGNDGSNTDPGFYLFFDHLGNNHTDNMGIYAGNWGQKMAILNLMPGDKIKIDYGATKYCQVQNGSLNPGIELQNDNNWQRNNSTNGWISSNEEVYITKMGDLIFTANKGTVIKSITIESSIAEYDIQTVGNTTTFKFTKAGLLDKNDFAVDFMHVEFGKADDYLIVQPSAGQYQSSMYNKDTGSENLVTEGSQSIPSGGNFYAFKPTASGSITIEGGMHGTCIHLFVWNISANAWETDGTHWYKETYPQSDNHLHTITFSVTRGKIYYICQDKDNSEETSNENAFHLWKFTYRRDFNIENLGVVIDNVDSQPDFFSVTKIENAGGTGTNPVTVKRCTGNISPSIHCWIQNGWIYMNKPTFADGTDHAGTVILDVVTENGEGTVVVTFPYHANFGADPNDPTKTSIGHTWNFIDPRNSDSNFGNCWYNAGLSHYSKGETSGILSIGQWKNTTSQFRQEYNNREWSWSRRVEGTNGTIHDPYYYNTFDMVGDNADMIWETEGLIFNTETNLSIIHNEGDPFVNPDVTNPLNFNTGLTYDPDRYVGLLPDADGQSSFTIPSLKGGDRVLIFMKSGMKLGDDDNDYGIFLKVHGAKDALGTSIDPNDLYKAGGTNYIGGNGHTRYEGCYHFIKEGDGDMTFDMVGGSMCKLMYVRIYTGDRIDTNDVLANKTVDGVTEGGSLLFINDKGATEGDGATLSLHYNGKVQFSAFEVLTYSGNLNDNSFTGDNFKQYGTYEEKLDFTSKVGEIGMFRLRAKDLEYNKKYVGDFSDRNFTVGYRDKVDSYPYTWDFTDIQGFSSPAMSAEASTYPEEPKASNDVYGNEWDISLFDANGYMKLNTGFKELSHNHIFDAHKIGFGNQLWAGGGVIPETKGLWFYTDDNDPLYNDCLQITQGGIRFCNTATVEGHKPWWNYKMVVPSVPANAAVYLRMKRDPSVAETDKMYSEQDKKNVLFLNTRFHFGTNPKTSLTEDGQNVYLTQENGSNYSFYQVPGTTDEYILAIKNTTGETNHLTYTLNGWIVEKLAVSTDSKNIGSTGFATESRDHVIDHTLTSYMTGLPIHAYIVTAATAAKAATANTPKQDGSVSVAPADVVMPASTGCFLANDMYNNEATDKSVKVLNNQTHLFAPDMHDTPVTIQINLMKARAEAGTIPATEGGLTNFVLSNKYFKDYNPDKVITGKVNFYRVADSGASTNANSAYLQIDTNTAASANVFFLVMEGSEDPLAEDFGDQDITAVKGIENAADIEGNWYNMNGQKLNGRPTSSGIYVVNGKKVVIK